MKCGQTNFEAGGEADWYAYQISFVRETAKLTSSLNP